MVFTEPREWLAGERGISSKTLNANIAANLDFMYDIFTQSRAVFRDIASIDLDTAPNNTLASLTINSRRESILLTCLFQVSSAGGIGLSYQVGSETDVIIRSFDADADVAWMEIIPSLAVGIHTVKVKFTASVAGITLSNCQFDLRELS